jgi:hypothetical protein
VPILIPRPLLASGRRQPTLPLLTCRAVSIDLLRGIEIPNSDVDAPPPFPLAASAGTTLPIVERSKLGTLDKCQGLRSIGGSGGGGAFTTCDSGHGIHFGGACTRASSGCADSEAVFLCRRAAQEAAFGHLKERSHSSLYEARAPEERIAHKCSNRMAAVFYGCLRVLSNMSEERCVTPEFVETALHMLFVVLGGVVVNGADDPGAPPVGVVERLLEVRQQSVRRPFNTVSWVCLN